MAPPDYKRQKGLLANPDISSVIRAVTITFCGPFVTLIEVGLKVRLSVREA